MTTQTAHPCPNPQCDQPVPNWVQACQTCGTYLIGRDNPTACGFVSASSDDGYCRCILPAHDGTHRCMHGWLGEPDPVNAILDAPAHATSQPAQPITPGSPTP